MSARLYIQVKTLFCCLDTLIDEKEKNENSEKAQLSFMEKVSSLKYQYTCTLHIIIIQFVDYKCISTIFAI